MADAHPPPAACGAAPTGPDDPVALAAAAAVDPDMLVYVNDGAVDPELICPICTDPLFQPVRLTCQCKVMVCQKHLVKLPQCPTCRAVVNVASLQPMTREGGDRVILNMLDRIEVRCTYAPRGCTWTGPRGNLPEHTERGCAHHQCPQANRAAGGCEWTGVIGELQRHIDECPYTPLPCPRADEGCDMLQIERRLLEQHVGNDCIVTLRERREAALAAEAEAEAARQREAERARQQASMRAALDRVNPPADRLVRLNVGGTFRATTHRATFSGPLCPSTSLLGALFDPASDRRVEVADGEVFIDRDGATFALLLRALVEGHMPPSFTAAQTAAVAAEAEFWRLDALQVQRHQRRDALEGDMPGILRVYTQAELDHIIDRCTQSKMTRVACQIQSSGQSQNFCNASFADLHFGASPCIAGWQFRECDFRGANLNGCDISGCKFDGCNLFGVDLSLCTGQNVNLTGANLEGARLPGNIQGWNFSQANLTGVDLSLCTGNYVNLTGANLEGARLPGVSTMEHYNWQGYQR
jgi:uncharacterized protein YjbI with pentapeptide repeats